MKAIRSFQEVLEIKAISKRYGNTIALDEISITAKAGEILGIAGPNGAGKSTLIKILAGEVEFDSGSIMLSSKNSAGESPISQVAVVHQELQVYPNLSVICLLYTSPSPRDRTRSRMPSSA